MEDKKIMQYANFNITFGQEEKPLLEYFDQIVLPAFQGEYIRENDNNGTSFVFQNVALKEIKDEIVLVGNYVKSTGYSARTQLKNNELVSVNKYLESAPFSRFIIFLRNHRMILVKNESASPDIRSFQAMVRGCLINFRYKQLKKNEHKRKIIQMDIPNANVNIVDMPLPQNIDEILKDVGKMEFLKLRFFPLNNDLDGEALFKAFRGMMDDAESKTGNMIINTPKSKQGVADIIKSTSGLVEPTLKVRDKTGSTSNLRPLTFTSKKEITYRGSLDNNHDDWLIELAKQDSIMNVVSDANNVLYESKMTLLRKLIRR